MKFYFIAINFVNELFSICSVQVKSAKIRKRPATDRDDNTQRKKPKHQSNQGHSLKEKKKKFVKNNSHVGKKKTPLPKKKSFDNSRNKATTMKKSKGGDSHPEGMRNNLIQDRQSNQQVDSHVISIHCLVDKEKPNIWQMKKKERKTYRKQHDVHYNLIHSIKQHYESLRRFVYIQFMDW